jgi:hypothetical protein
MDIKLALRENWGRTSPYSSSPGAVSGVITTMLKRRCYSLESKL